MALTLKPGELVLKLLDAWIVKSIDIITWNSLVWHKDTVIAVIKKKETVLIESYSPKNNYKACS